MLIIIGFYTGISTFELWIYPYIFAKGDNSLIKDIDISILIVAISNTS